MQTLSKNNSISQQESTALLASIMDLVLVRAKQKGATDAAVLASQDIGLSVDVRKGSVETIEFNEDKGVSVVVYIGHQKGVASSTDVSVKSLNAMVDAAYDIAKESAADPCFGLPDAELMTTQHPDLDLFHPWVISPQQAIDKAIACEEKAFSLDPRIINSDGANLFTYSFYRGQANSRGGCGFAQGTRHGMSCSLLAKDKNEGMQRDYDFTTARKSTDLATTDALAAEAVRRTIGRLNPRKIKTQKVPVLFSSRLSSSLFGAFIQAISGGNLYKKNSFLVNSLGQQVFPKNITIYEQPRLQCALGSAAFDDEGVPTRDNVFVRDGIVSQYVLGSYSARRLGLKTTANSGGVYNLTIDPTAGGESELLKTMGKGLFVTELMGDGGNILTGDYSRGASGFWIEDGAIQYPVHELTIAGNLKDMFTSIVAVGDDRNPNIAARCGSVLIDSMVVAGQ